MRTLLTGANVAPQLLMITATHSPTDASIQQVTGNFVDDTFDGQYSLQVDINLDGMVDGACSLGGPAFSCLMSGIPATYGVIQARVVETEFETGEQLAGNWQALVLTTGGLISTGTSSPNTTGASSPNTGSGNSTGGSSNPGGTTGTTSNSNTGTTGTTTGTGGTAPSTGGTGATGAGQTGAGSGSSPNPSGTTGTSANSTGGTGSNPNPPATGGQTNGTNGSPPNSTSPGEFQFSSLDWSPYATLFSPETSFASQEALAGWLSDHEDDFDDLLEAYVQQTAIDYTNAVNHLQFVTTSTNDHLAQQSQQTTAEYQASQQSAYLQRLEAVANANQLFSTRISQLDGEYATAEADAEAAWNLWQAASQGQYSADWDVAEAEYQNEVLQIQSTFDAQRATVISAQQSRGLIITATHVAAIAAADQNLSAALAASQAAYSSAIEAARTIYASARASHQAQREAEYQVHATARDQARGVALSTLQSALANYSGVSLNESGLNGDAIFQALVIAADTARAAANDATADAFADAAEAAAGIFQSAYDVAKALYDAAERQAETRRNGDLGAAETQREIALNAALADRAAAVTTAEGVRASARNVARGLYDNAVAQAALNRDASRTTAEANYNLAVSGAQTTRDQDQGQNSLDFDDDKKDLWNGYADDVEDAAGTHNSGAGQLAGDFEAAALAADRVYNLISADARNDIQAARGRVAVDNAAEENRLWLQEQSVLIAYMAYEMSLQAVTSLGTPLPVTPVFKDQVLDAIKTYHVKSARLGVQATMLASAAIRGATVQDGTARKAMAKSIGDASYSQATESAVASWTYADAVASSKGQYLRDLANLEAALRTEQRRLDTVFQVDQLDAWSVRETQYVLAEWTYRNAVARAQQTLDNDEADAQRIYDRSVALADQQVADAAAVAHQSYNNNVAAADVAKTTALAVPYAAFGGTVNTATVALQQTVMAAYVQYQTGLANNNVTHVTAVETARADAYIRAANGDPAVAAVANAQSAWTIANAVADAQAQIADAVSDQAASILDSLAWKVAADARVTTEVQQAQADAQAGAAWVAETSQADRDQSEALADAALDADRTDADNIHTASQREAVAQLNRALGSNTAARQAGNRDVAGAYTRDLASIGNAAARDNASITAEQTQVIALANAEETQLKALAFAEMDRAIDLASARHDALPGLLEAEYDAVLRRADQDQAGLLLAARTRLQQYQRASLTSFESELYTVNRAFTWMWNDGLDMTTDFFAGWADTLTFGGYGFLMSRTYGNYIHWDSTAYGVGRGVGAAHTFVIAAVSGGPCAVGWAANVARGYAYAQTAAGFIDFGAKAYNNQLTLMDGLSLVPLGGVALGRLGLFGCFTAGTPVATGWTSPPVWAGLDAGAAPERFDTTSLLVGAVGIALGTTALRRRKRNEDEETSPRPRFPLDEPEFSGDDVAQRNRSMLPSPRPLLTVIDLDPQPPASAVPVTYPAGIAISLRDEHSPGERGDISPPGDNLPRRRQTTSPPRRTLSTWAWTAAAILGFTIGGWNLWHAGTSLHATTVTAKSAPVPRELMTQPIESLRPGMRVLADNPELTGAPLSDLDIDPQTHRLLTYRLVRPDGSAVEWDRIEPAMEMAAELLTTLPDDADVRPRPFVGSATDVLLQELLVGGQIEIDLPELGATGAATIIAVKPCPQIEPDDGTGRRLITSVYRHTAKTVYDVEIAGQSPIGATGNHPFWSEDRNAFVRTDELRNGERLRQANGSTTTVTAVTLRAHPEPVYNIEVDAEHVYYVGKNGVLVHNAPCTFGSAAFGQRVHNNFAGYLSSFTSTRIKFDRTAPGLRGLDITFMNTVRGLRDSTGNLAAGFKHAELKPATQAGVDAFISQLRNWRGQGTRGNVGLFLYDEFGRIRFFGTF